MPCPIDFMQQALALSEKARLQAPPNPWVGCVIVKEEKVIGQGYTQPPGQAHAEICALRQAKEKARGATLYVTLEPCAHTGRTPPCTEALIHSGIQEVYLGIEDPDKRVQGKGINQLREAGIKVHQGLCADQIKHSLAPYLYHRQTTLPYTTLKIAMSLDGRVAAADFTSQWITCSQARADVHKQRAYAQAILIGAKTALKDLPQLTIRHPEYLTAPAPLRVLLDAKGQVPAKGPLFDCTLAPTLIITTTQAPQDQLQEWQKRGAEIAIVSSAPAGVNLEEVWQLLGKRSILHVLVEGGSTLSTALLDTALVNRLLVYIAPMLLGSSALPMYQKWIPTLQEAYTLALQEVQVIGECIRAEYWHKN